MIKVHLGCIYELNFGYNTKMEGYTNSSSDIPELYEIRLGRTTKNLKADNIYYNEGYKNAI